MKEILLLRGLALSLEAKNLSYECPSDYFFLPMLMQHHFKLFGQERLA